MNTIRILVLCLITTIGFAQKKLSKTSQSIKVNKDVVVDLNTSYAEIEISTWNKDIVEVEAYIESNKLTEEQLERALEAWNLRVDGSNDKVTISSQGGRALGLFGEVDYTALLRDLEFELADMPEIPEITVLPMPMLADMPAMPDMPEMPEFPELPELPDGIKSISFDYDKYQEEGEKYLAEWSEKYEKKGGKELQEKMEAWAKKFAESGYQEKMTKWGEEYGKRFEGKWAKEMEEWGEKFGKSYAKDMEKWGEEFGEKFGKEWAEKMEAWGERLGKQMEKQAAKMEKDAERASKMAEREARIAERYAERAQAVAERSEAMEERREQMRDQRESILERRLESGNNSKVRKVIKMKIPKKAKLKTNIRHGELKLSSVLYNMEGEISHSSLLAESIDGSETSINTSYSDVLINNWLNGTLGLKFVDNALLKNVQGLSLTSNSSNINIDYLSGNSIIDGSFGELTIHKILDSFNNLNLVLENSEAWVKIPSVEYSLMFNGDRSKFNNEYKKVKTINGNNTNKSIIINAKYSNVTMN